MTKKIEGTFALAAGALAVLLVAQMHDVDVKQKARQDNEVELTEQLNRAAVESFLNYETELAKKAEKVPEKIKDASEVSEKEMYALAQKCFKKWNCYKLAEATYFEDRSGGRTGMRAVANVIVNRVNSGQFPTTIAGVVNQKKWTKNGWVCQFSYMCQLKDRRMKDEDSRILAGYVAWRAYDGIAKDITNGATHYYNPDKVKRTPNFAKEYTQVAAISDHLFYRSM